MRKAALMFLSILFITGSISTPSTLSHAQELQETDQAIERIPVLREAKEFKKSTVAVEAHLIDNIMEVKTTVRMYNTKPKIHNALIVGPRLGRLSIQAKKVLLASVEEEEPYPTSRKDRGLISFGRKKKNKKAEGRLTRELLEFKIPRDKIIKGKRYQLWIQTTSLQKGGRHKTYKFDLENLAELLEQSSQ